jgi:hypothetical protein
MSGTLSIPGLVPDEDNAGLGAAPTPQQLALLQAAQLQQQQAAANQGPPLGPVQNAPIQTPPQQPQQAAPAPQQAPAAPPPQQAQNALDAGVAADIGMGAPPSPLPPHQTPGLQMPPAAPPNVPPPGLAARLQAAQQAQGGQQPTQAPAQAPQAPAPAAPAAATKPRDYGALAVQDWTAESQFRNVNNPNSSASGPGQMTDATFGAYVQSPANAYGYTMADKNNPQAQFHASQWTLQNNDRQLQTALGRPVTDGELNASYMLGPNGATALLKNPTANAYDTLKAIEPGTVDQVFSGNGGVINKDMTGAEAVTAISNFYANGGQTHGGGGGRPGGGGSGGGQPQAVIGADFTADQSPSVRLQQAQNALNPQSLMDYLSQPGMQQLAKMMRPSQSEQLLALGAGLLGGPTLGRGLGRGAENLLQLNMQGRQNYGELANMANQDLYRQAMLGNAAGRLGVAQQNADIHQQTANQGSQRVQIAQQNANAANSGQRAFNAKMGQEGAEGYNELMDGTEQDTQALSEIQQAEKIAQTNPSMLGPGLAAQAQREAMNLGLADPAKLQAYQKMTADQRMEYLQNATGGHVGGIRSNAELENIGKAVANAQTDPKAAMYLMEMQKAQIQARMAARADAQGNPDDWGRNFAATESKFYTNYFRNNPLPEFQDTLTPQSPGQQSAAPASRNAKGVNSGVINGIPYTFTPNQ